MRERMGEDESSFQVDAIDLADLRKDKTFVKMQKKQQKDVEEMKKKHTKQRENIQKQQVRGRPFEGLGYGRGLLWREERVIFQQSTVDKLMTDNQRSQKRKGGSGSRHQSLSGKESDPGKIAEQAKVRFRFRPDYFEYRELEKRCVLSDALSRVYSD